MKGVADFEVDDTRQEAGHYHPEAEHQYRETRR